VASEGLSLSTVAKLLARRSHPDDVREVKEMRDKAHRIGLSGLESSVRSQAMTGVRPSKILICNHCGEAYGATLPSFDPADFVNLNADTAINLIDSFLAPSICPLCGM